MHKGVSERRTLYGCWQEKEVSLDCRGRKWYSVSIKQKGENPVKRCATISLAGLLAVCLTGCGGGEKKGIGAAILLILLGAALLGLAVLRTRSFYAYCRIQRRKGRRVPKNMDVFTWGLYGVAGVLLLMGLIIACVPRKEPEQEQLLGQNMTGSDGVKFSWDSFQRKNPGSGSSR